jgi:transcriptional regulator with XRE-family HTH domain
MTMNQMERRQKLGEFLRQRREGIRPTDIGLLSTNRRRTPGLRREEVAVLSDISLTYYTKIEQGRLDVTLPVLESLAAALRLNRAEREYAFALATGLTASTPESRHEEVNDTLHYVLKSQGANPAYIMGRRWDILAWNEAACALLGDFAAMDAWDRNVVVQIFARPTNRQFISNWEKHAKIVLAEFRANYGSYHDDPEFKELIAYLQEHSEEFRDWWVNYYQVGAQVSPHKRIEHPAVGRLLLQQCSFYVDGSPNLRMIMYLPGDEATAEKLVQLGAMWETYSMQNTPASANGRETSPHVAVAHEG